MNNDWELVYVIVNYGMGSKVLKFASEFQISNACLTYGLGTIKNKLLNFLSLYDERKEIILLMANSLVAQDFMQKLNYKFKLYQKHQGIVFSISILNIVSQNDQINLGDNSMYNIIFTVVNKGMAEDVIDSASLAGANGGTILNGRGSGIGEVSGLLKVFNVDIEPEKEIVLILVPIQICSQVVDKIRKDLKIDDCGNGVIFVQNVNQVYGLYEEVERSE